MPSHYDRGNIRPDSERVQRALAEAEKDKRSKKKSPCNWECPHYIGLSGDCSQVRCKKDGNYKYHPALKEGATCRARDDAIAALSHQPKY